MILIRDSIYILWIKRSQDQDTKIDHLAISQKEIILS